MNNKIMFSSHCLAVILILSQTLVSAQTSDLISQVCSRSEVLYTDLCEKTLRADPASQSADIHGLAKISLSASLKDSTAVKAKIDDLIKSSPGKLTAALNDCRSMYDDANEQLSESADFIEKRKYRDVNVYVSAAMTNGDSCEDGFDPGSSPLTKDNENFIHLCSNVLAISNIASTS